MTDMTCLVCSHHMALIERHEISLQPLGDLDAEQCQSVLTAARTAATAWLEQQGLDASITEFTDRHGVGVRFDVHVCHADAVPAGTEFRYLWSQRWRAWSAKFAALNRASRAGHPVHRDSKVIPLHGRRR